MVLFMDGASHYNTALLNKKYAAVDTFGVTWSVVPGEGRTDGCIKRVCTTNQSSGGLTIAPLFTQNGVWSPQITGRIGFALKIDNVTASTGSADAGSTAGTFNGVWSVYAGGRNHLRLAVNPSGTFTLYRATGGAAPTLLANSVQGLTSGVWAYVEVVWLLSTGSNGILQVYVNNTQVMSFAGRTCPDGGDMFPFTPVSPNWTSVLVLALASAPVTPMLTLRMCDLYLADGVAPNGSRLGDVTVAYIKPTGVGVSSEWTPTTAPNWDCVDGVPPNGTDTPSVAAANVNLKDTYQMQDVIGNPLAIQTVHFVRKTSEGAAGFKPVLRLGGVDYAAANEQSLGSTAFSFKLQVMDVSPATAVPFTKTELDAAESGQIKTT